MLRTISHDSKNVDFDHLQSFYVSHNDIKDRYYDGMIITGAPVENLDFKDVDYWPELCEIMEWSKSHVHSTFHICWGAQAGLYYHYGIQKYTLSKKVSGIYNHQFLNLMLLFSEDLMIVSMRLIHAIPKFVLRISNRFPNWSCLPYQRRQEFLRLITRRAVRFLFSGIPNTAGKRLGLNISVMFHGRSGKVTLIIIVLVLTL